MQPPQSVEEIKAGLETTEKGGVRQSIRNCLTVFQRDPLLSGAIAYNILTDRKDIIKPIGFHRESTALNDTDMKYLLLYLEETYGLTNEKKIDNAIGIVANENKYHPIRDYLNTLVWDGTERIRFCLRHFLGADADDYTYEALKHITFTDKSCCGELFEDFSKLLSADFDGSANENAAMGEKIMGTIGTASCVNDANYVFFEK